MNKFIKALSIVVVLTSSAFLSTANAASATSTNEMLITLAETNPVLIDRLNDIALNDAQLLKDILSLAENDEAQLERLIYLAESAPEMFAKLVTINQAATEKEVVVEETAEVMVSTFGSIDDGGIIRE